ncbi:hypothetical protein [Planctomicrobium sp. SH527]|uniref:hypothetical protein n=1 Tax=Planctomicrobium sp. SH527 TaxID=3448123 RepID=UPI003F5C5A69
MNATLFQRQLQLLLLAGVMMASGCQQMLKLKPGMGRSSPEASAEHPVFEAICLWEQGEGNGLDGLPTRGFVGQVMFFAHGIDAPVRVDGDLMVYVFDDVGTEEEQQKPIHQFEFNSVAMKAFLTETNVGTAYQFFIPYTRKGAQKATCSLRVRLTPKTGNPVYSKMSSIVLAGKTARKPEVAVSQPLQVHAEGIQLASHETASTSHSTIPTVSPSAQSNGEDMLLLKSKLSQLTQSAGVKTLPATSVSGADAAVDTAGNRTVPREVPQVEAKPIATSASASESVPQKTESKGGHILLDGASPNVAEKPAAVSSGGMRLKAAATSTPVAATEKVAPKAFPDSAVSTSAAGTEAATPVSGEPHPIEGETSEKKVQAEPHPLLD